MALDSARSSADNCVRNNPGRCPTYQGGAATEARSATLDTNHEPMDTVATSTTSAQLSADLRDLSRADLQKQVRSILGGGSRYELSVAGIVARCDVRHGEVTDLDSDRSAIDDAEEFFAFFGAPVTHERAQRIIAGTEAANGGEFAHLFDDELERATESVLEVAREVAMENYYGI